MPQGFRDRFEKVLQEESFPIQVSEITDGGESAACYCQGGAGLRC
jgi:hypothetical protein